MNPASVEKLEKTLLAIAITLVVMIAAGTVLGLVKKSTANIDAGSRAAQSLISKGKATALNAPVSDDVTAYFEIGRIRLTTAAENKKADGLQGTVMVISPWLSYAAGDTVFYEELARKKAVIKVIFSSYFSSRTKNQLLGKTEEKICAELLSEINSRLSLGKITGINFTDYIFLE